MATASFSFGEIPKRTMQIHWSGWGREKYVLDGKTLLTRWDLSLSGERVFNVDGHRLRIVFHLSKNDYYSRVHLDDEVLVQELFPEIEERWKKVREQGVWGGFAKNLIIWFFIGLVGMSAYQYFFGKQQNRECPRSAEVAASSDSSSCRSPRG